MSDTAKKNRKLVVSPGVKILGVRPKKYQVSHVIEQTGIAQRQSVSNIVGRNFRPYIRSERLMVIAL